MALRTILSALFDIGYKVGYVLQNPFETHSHMLYNELSLWVVSEAVVLEDIAIVERCEVVDADLTGLK